MFWTSHHVLDDALIGIVTLAVIVFLTTGWAVWCCRDRSSENSKRTQAH